MLTSILQSFRYVGHFYPLAVLRIYVGVIFFSKALQREANGFLEQPHLAASIEQWVPTTLPPEWLQSFYESVMVSQWQLFSYIIFSCELLVGLSYLLGFGIRPISWIGILLSANFLYISSPLEAPFYKMLMVLIFLLALLGAGRCFGIDYYFFKRIRGLWW